VTLALIASRQRIDARVMADPGGVVFYLSRHLPGVEVGPIS
jgi:hypothetical protein